MLAILAITFPFFALIAAGYIAVTTKWLAVDAVRGLNSFVLYVALPCMLFKFSTGLDLETLWRQPFLPIYGAVGLALFAILIMAGRLRQIAWRDLSFIALVGVFPNTGFIGVPLLVSMMGPRAATPAVAVVMFDMLLTSSLAVATSTLDGHDWSSARGALADAFKGVLSNPMLGAMLVGMFVAVMHWQPGPVWRGPIWMLADATTPVALFTTGAILARSHIEGAPEHRNQLLLPFIVAKLCGHPMLMWAAVWTAPRIGWRLEPWVQQSLVLLAALPSASNVSFLAERMGGSAAWVARVILWTTVGAFGTFTLWGWLVVPTA